MSASKRICSLLSLVINQVTILSVAILNVLHAGNSGSFDYISVTPPYTQVDYGVLMRKISESVLIGEDTFIVCGSFSPFLFFVRYQMSFCSVLTKFMLYVMI